jgi:hypothetical protein
MAKNFWHNRSPRAQKACLQKCTQSAASTITSSPKYDRGQEAIPELYIQNETARNRAQASYPFLMILSSLSQNNNPKTPCRLRCGPFKPFNKCKLKPDLPENEKRGKMGDQATEMLVLG